MLEVIRRLRLEIDSLSSLLRKDKHAYVVDHAVLERIQELFNSWSGNVHPLLTAGGIPTEVLQRTNTSFERLVRLTSRRNRKREYLEKLRGLRRIIVEQILLEVANISRTPQARVAEPVVRPFLPEIPDLSNDLVPNSLYGWISNMQEFLRRNSFDRNVFLMFAYQSELTDLVECVKSQLMRLGLNPVVAKDHRLTDDLYNPIACLLCCNYGVAIFHRANSMQVHNPNIVYELAIMQLLKRPCVILKHQSIKTMPSDFLHKLYESYNSVAEATKRICEWWAMVSSR